MIIKILYCMAAVIALGACIPQVACLLRSKQADSFSVSSWVAWTVTQFVTLVYVVSIRNTMMTLVSVAWVSFYIVMIVLILHYKKQTFLPAGVSEPSEPIEQLA